MICGHVPCEAYKMWKMSHDVTNTHVQVRIQLSGQKRCISVSGIFLTETTALPSVSVILHVIYDYGMEIEYEMTLRVQSNY